MTTLLTVACPRFESEEVPCDSSWLWAVQDGHIVGLHQRFCTHPIDAVMDCLARADALLLLALNTAEAA